MSVSCYSEDWVIYEGQGSVSLTTGFWSVHRTLQNAFIHGNCMHHTQGAHFKGETDRHVCFMLQWKLVDLLWTKEVIPWPQAFRASTGCFCSHLSMVTTCTTIEGWILEGKQMGNICFMVYDILGCIGCLKDIYWRGNGQGLSISCIRVCWKVQDILGTSYGCHLISTHLESTTAVCAIVWGI